MAITYPSVNLCDCGRFRLGLGFNYGFLHQRWGFDLGERYHQDPEYRIRTTLDIDRAVFEAYGALGLGWAEPAPRPSVEPFGHRFVPALYGCPVAFAPDAEPWARARLYADDEIERLPEWTLERFERAEPVRETVAQARYLLSRYGPFPTLQNLGSVINTAIYLMGDDLFIGYHEKPAVVRKLYGHIARLMNLCLDFFPALDGLPLERVGLGNCCVSMISPADYLACNDEADRAYMAHCREKGIHLTLHQDSNVTLHLDHYARLDYADGCDFGMDTDFARLAELRPADQVNCIWFPHWLATRDIPEIEAEAGRIIEAGRRFPAFSCSLYEIDAMIGDDRLFAFCAALRRAAQRACGCSRRGSS